MAVNEFKVKLQPTPLLLARHFFAFSLILLMGACSTVRSPSPADPFEGFNRSVDVFNRNVDTYALKPVAKGYLAVVPEPIRQGVSNFFSNIGDVIVAINNLLQGKPKSAASDIGRFAVNSTIGVLGLFDVATDMGLKKHDEDFGQTLGYWGVGPGPYLVLPFFGPSNVRDGLGFVVDRQTDIASNLPDVSTRNTLFGTRIVNRRAELLDISESVEGVAFDPYSFVRDAYLANRRNRVFDGDPPMEKMLDDYDDPERP